MVDPKASRFWKVALQSGLIDEEALQACFESIAPEKRIAEQLDRRLARQAIQQGRLTIWQAQQLLAGRSSGFRINRYLLLDMLGQGGMGRVYLAKDTRLNRRVALKILSPERMNNPRAIARFQREARVGAQLQHENLVRIYDEGESNGKCYLVMEYIEGKNLGGILAENGPIPPAAAARLIQQIALGLEHAQQKGLIHRDVNPYNILVTREGVAKLTDLGLAIDQTEEAQVTREGATVGTFDYVSPEQARHSHSVDTRSDIYSLGCTLYHILSAQVPFPSPSLPEKLFGHQAVEPVPLTTLVPGIPEGLAAVVEKMMKKSPDERYPTPLDVAQALDAYTDVPAGTLYASSPPPAGRGVGRTSVSETQVVDGPPVASGSVGVETEVATRLVDEAPTLPVPSASTSPTTRPSPLSAPVPPAVEARGPASVPVPGPATPPAQSRSNEDWSDLGLAINLGPEPSLTEGLQSGKKRSRSSSTDIPAETPPAEASDEPGTTPVASTLAEPSARVRVGAVAPPASLAAASTNWLKKRRWLIGAGAFGMVAVVASILFGSGLIDQVRHGGESKNTHGSSSTAEGTSTPRPGVKSKSESKSISSSKPKQITSEVPAGQSFAVKTPDGEIVPEPDLRSAIQRAIGSKGHILLNNREPLKLTGNDAAIIAAGGPLFIRAAEGARPVLEVELKGPKPFLLTRSDTPLTIVGVTIVSRYSGKPKVVPAVIEAGGNVTLERCAFSTRDTVKGSRAVAAAGRDLTVSGCWFEGFDAALDIASFAGSTAAIKQSMMVRGRTDDQPFGWGIRVWRTPGGNTKADRHLVIDHCTVKGKGLLHLVDFSPQAPFRVEINQCAVLADALLAWETPRSDTGLTVEALKWKGDGNQYDIHGKAWVVLSSDGTRDLPDSPVDLASWRSRLPEQDPLHPPIRFQTSPESLSESPQPRDFTIIDQDIQPPGADPHRVGPGARP
jgi:serine/threonine-protein kinase